MTKVYSYIKFTEIDNGETTLTFNEIGSKVEVKVLKKGFAVLKGDSQNDINELIDSQRSEISSTQIPKELFMAEIIDCEAIKAIDEATGLRIRNRYSINDELAMNYKDENHPEKIEFLRFRDEQIRISRDQKQELGL